MKLKGLLSTAVAIATGLIVLVGYFVEIPILVNLRITILNWVILLAAVALFVGLFNLLAVHADKIRNKQKGGIYSLVLIFSLLTTLILGLWLRPDHALMALIFNAIQLPVETSLMAMLVVTLTYASIRLLRRRNNLISIIFLVTALLILLGTAPLPFVGYVPILSDLIRPFIAQVLAAAGARGILIGVALGSLTTGLRVLFGADRPYGSDPSRGGK
ncbi:MAG: hypothetical protein CO064_00960 [Anaerolineae bacterium CG_4_9_14_0_8_um_filter_58_9]|nr:MAG: hypothetical protein CO064_00960 [Anaerolineae bacterium CG_4_9_14_0_8_um_filter_58_9]